MKRVLFIVAQAGQAAYFEPLWRLWFDRCSYDWKILAHEQARGVIDRCIPEVSSYCLDGWEDEARTLEHLFADWAPDLIISSVCGRDREIEASSYAQKYGVKHFQVIDSWYNYGDRIRRSNSQGHMPDLIGVIDDWARDIAIDEGLPCGHLVCLGHPVWEKSIGTNGFSAPRERVVFASQPLSEIPSMRGLGYTEHDVWEHLLKFRAAYPELIQELVYLPHPSQVHRPANLPNFARFPENGESPVHSCGTMVCMFSAIMVEGYLVGQHVIGLQPNLKQDNICPLYQRCCVEHVLDYDFETLASAFRRPSFSDGREMLVHAVEDSLKRLDETICKSLVSS